MITPRLVSCLWMSLVFTAGAADSGNLAWFAHVWKSDDGLPNNQVTGVVQTPDGYLWVSTFSRPARFDGVHFEEYFLREFALAANQKITALGLNGGGGLWMGTSHGQIVSLTPKAVRIFSNGLPNLVTLTLTEDAEGSLWATFQGGAVCRLKGTEVTSFTAAEGLPEAGNRQTQVSSITRDHEGRIWFSRNGRAGVFRNGRFEKLLDLPPVGTRLTSASAGGVWICYGGQLGKYDEGKALENLPAANPLPTNSEPTALIEDRQGGVWIGTAQHGLFHYNGSDFESVPTSDQSITCLSLDREDNIWVGTASDGLNRVRPRVVELETGLPSGTMLSLCEGADKTLWAATQNGLLVCRKEGRWQTVSTNGTWPGGRAACVTADQTGAVWIGTRDQALHRWRDGHFTSWLPRDGLTGHQIHALLVGQSGDIWLGETTPDIVQRLHDGKLETFRMPPNIRVIRAMAEDVEGNIWVGTSAGMLIRISNGVVTDETARTTGEPLSIRYLHATPDGSLWIGYADEGVGWIKNGRFAHITAERGFPEGNVSQIISDTKGRLWFGGDHGMFKVQQSELEEFAEGRAVHLNSIRFGQSEGISGLEANTGASPGSMRDSDGRIWIPMRNALAVASPDRLHEDPIPPPVLLKRVVVDDQVVALYGGAVPVTGSMDLQNPAATLQLPPGHHRLELEFTALSFGAPENIRFRYRLEGFDENWTEGAQRSVSYSRLAAGNYRFCVKACGSRGIWNEKGTALALAVAPFVWQTWWFRLIILAVFTALVAAVARYISFRRLRLKLEGLERQAALDKERARIARDIHDDLGSRFTELELMIELANRAPTEKLNGNMRQISSTVRKAGESLDEIVWAVNPRHDTLPHLVDYLGRYAIEFLQTADIRCRVDIPDVLPDRSVPPEVRHNLFLAVKEALNNVARHARATEIWLSVSVANAALTIIIKDDGRGFNGSPVDLSADGLRNMHQRMAEIGGEFQIETGPNAGTRISMRYPWKSS